MKKENKSWIVIQKLLPMLVSCATMENIIYFLTKAEANWYFFSHEKNCSEELSKKRELRKPQAINNKKKWASRQGVEKCKFDK